MQGQSRSSSSLRSLVASVMAPSMPVTSGRRRAAANLISRSGSRPSDGLCRRHFAEVCGPLVSAAVVLKPCASTAVGP
jgi:hypothetical protein